MHRHLALLLALLLPPLPACGVFDDDNATLSDSEAEGESESETTGEPPWPPSEGFRVFPKYLLQDVPAIVSIEIDGEPVSCPPDSEAEGGYLCDTSVAAGPLAQLSVERDGFAPALRAPELAGVLLPLDVHLYVEGGPLGSWSSCQATELHASCTELCEAEQLGCAPASCASEDPENPVASLLTFDDPECLLPLAAQVPSCTDALPPVNEAAALQCCCG